MNGIPDLKGLMEAAQALEQRMARVKEELGLKRVKGESGGGMVVCTANGQGDLLGVEIEPALLEPGSKKMLEDLVTAAVNSAIERARQVAQEEVARISGGLGNLSGFPTGL